jgi:hypothetical protein
VNPIYPDYESSIPIDTKDKEKMSNYIDIDIDNTNDNREY